MGPSPLLPQGSAEHTEPCTLTLPAPEATKPSGGHQGSRVATPRARMEGMLSKESLNEKPSQTSAERALSRKRGHSLSRLHA